MSLRIFLDCGALPASASMLLLSACVSFGDMSDIKAASELAIDCQTEQALQAADRAAQSGGFAGGFGELLRVAFLRDAGRTAEATAALDARNRRVQATTEEAKETDRAVDQSVANLQAERRKRTGSPHCAPTR
jgi:hypothetical protein